MNKTENSLEGVRVLVLDDQDSIRRFLHRMLSKEGCLVETVRNGQEGLHVLLKQDFDVAVLDLRMPEMDGMAFMQEARKIWPWLGIVITSGYLDDRDIEKARLAGVNCFIPKPIDGRALIKAVQQEVEAKKNKTKVLGSQMFDQIQYQLAILRQIGESAIEAQSLVQALKGLSAGIGRVMVCDVVGMLGVESDERVIIVKLQEPQPKSVIAQIVGEMINRYRVLTGKDLSVDNVRVEIDGTVLDNQVQVDIGSITTVPVITAGEVCGLMMLASLKPGAFSVPNITFLYHAANHLSTFMTALGRMRQLSIRDYLTGLYNRRHIDTELQRLCSMTKRYRTPMSVMILDVDFFKQINDTYGHQIGDQVIKEAGAILQKLVRTSDIVGRYGGDEFILLLPKADAPGAKNLADRIMRIVRENDVCQDTKPMRLSFSIGIATYMPEDRLASHEELLARADQALYAAKAEGRNRISTWEEVQANKRDMDARHAPVPVSPILAESVAVNSRVLVVDDDEQMGILLSRMLKPTGCNVEVKTTADAGIAAIKEKTGEFDVVLTDLSLPGQDGFAFLEAIEQIDPTVVRVVITGHATLDNAIAAMRHGAYDFVGKPFVQNQLIAVLKRALQYRRLVVENQRYQHYLEDMIQAKNAEVLAALDDVKRSYDFTLEALVAMLDAREFETSQHSIRVRDLTLILATHMQVDGAALKDIGRGALLHDIGKIGIPDAILLKPGAFTDDEWQVMKQHPKIGYNFLKNSSFLKNADEIVLAHHERYDGTGYPRGLQGEQICLGARIFSILDVYDALRSPRRYKKSMSVEEASAEIRSQSGKHFDPAVVKAFFECQDKIEHVGMWSYAVAMSN